MKNVNLSLERQTLSVYRSGFETYLSNSQMNFKRIKIYLDIFDKCFKIGNIMSYKNMKMQQIKAVLDQFAKNKKINTNEF